MDIKNHKKKRHIIIVGLNHTCSNVEFRDQVLFSGSKLDLALDRIKEIDEIHESVILSTCNRVEIYAVVTNIGIGKEKLIEFFGNFHNVPVKELACQVYYYNCEKAIKHLYNVVSSLDSMVIGETQIMGQVKNAYSIACKNGNTQSYLNKFFHFAIEAGKRVQTDTLITRGVVSISSIAVDLAKKVLGNLDNKKALILGAGEMSKLTARYLSNANIKKIFFANRTLENVTEMAKQFDGDAILLKDWPSKIHDCDIVVSSTGAPHYVIHKEQVETAMAKRKNSPIFFIDIAVPRDIDPEISSLYNVFLYSIDDLAKVGTENNQKRLLEIDKARVLIDEELKKYVEWYNEQKVIPTLVKLRKEFENLHDEELERYSKTISTLPKEAQETVKKFAASLTKKFLRGPSKVLKGKAYDDDGYLFSEVVSLLFELDKKDK